MVDGVLRRRRAARRARSTLVAVTIGPGSFTGIRVGLAAAQGIALGLDRPLIGVTGFEAVAAICGPDSINCNCDLLVALESRRADFYVQIFDAAGRPLGAPAAVLPQGARRGCRAGGRRADARRLPATPRRALQRRSALAPARSSSRTGGPRPRCPARGDAALAWRRTRRSPVQPLYLRPPDVTRPPHGLPHPELRAADCETRIVSRRLQPVSGAAAGALAAPLSMLHRACFPGGAVDAGGDGEDHRDRRVLRADRLGGRYAGRLCPGSRPRRRSARSCRSACCPSGGGAEPARRCSRRSARRRGGAADIASFSKSPPTTLRRERLYRRSGFIQVGSPQPLLPPPGRPGRRAGAALHDRVRPALDLSSRSPSSALPWASRIATKCYLRRSRDCKKSAIERHCPGPGCYLYLESQP